MARPPVRPEKQRELLERFERLGILEKDLEERFVRASGRGGQKLHKTSSCVRLTHRPTGVRVRCEASRSQSLNRFLARRRLAEELERRGEGARKEEQAARDRARRRKARAGRRLRNRLRAAKKGSVGPLDDEACQADQRLPLLPSREG
jgi:protein subunit release factor B